jgi:hypothetical protein
MDFQPDDDFPIHHVILSFVDLADSLTNTVDNLAATAVNPLKACFFHPAAHVTAPTDAAKDRGSTCSGFRARDFTVKFPQPYAKPAGRRVCQSVAN